MQVEKGIKLTNLIKKEIDLDKGLKAKEIEKKIAIIRRCINKLNGKKNLCKFVINTIDSSFYYIDVFVNDNEIIKCIEDGWGNRVMGYGYNLKEAFNHIIYDFKYSDYLELKTIQKRIKKK